jgi:hypothetical protein
MDEERVEEIIQRKLDERDKQRRNFWHYFRAALYAIIRLIEKEFDIKPSPRNN